MKQVVLNIKEEKYRFFMELLKSLDFVEVQPQTGDKREDIEANLTQSFKELKKYKQGELKTTSAKEFLNEL